MQLIYSERREFGELTNIEYDSHCRASGLVHNGFEEEWFDYRDMVRIVKTPNGYFKGMPARLTDWYSESFYARLLNSNAPHAGVAGAATSTYSCTPSPVVIFPGSSTLSSSSFDKSVISAATSFNERPSA